MKRDQPPALFDLADVEPSDPNVVAGDRPRLSEQSARILALLTVRTRTNVELAKVALKYTSRISDLRAAGHDVRVVERGRDGVVVYGLYRNGKLAVSS